MSQATNQQEFDRASQVLVGGVNSAVRAFRAVGGTPRFIQRAEGARMWDVEGKAYIDYVGSWGPAIVGQLRGLVGAGHCWPLAPRGAEGRAGGRG